MQVILERRVHGAYPVQRDREVMTAFRDFLGRKDAMACRGRRAELALRVKMADLVHPEGQANRYVMVLYCQFVAIQILEPGHFILQQDYTKHENCRRIFRSGTDPISCSSCSFASC